MKLGLYPYQLEPLRKFRERGNLLVSYEMGTGKTAIAIACAEETDGWCLVVCPASLRIQWANQIAKFTDSNVLIVPGSPPKKRQEMYEWFEKRDSKYLIMSYETVVNDARYVRRLDPGLVVLDEASAIKTFKAQRTKKVKQILKAPKRIALTGTPLENRPDEVYSIMQWVDPDVLGRWDLFDRTYIVRDQWGGVVRYQNLPVLHRRLSPAQSRAKRSDPDVKPYLPDEDYDVWTAEMTGDLRYAYQQMCSDLLNELDAAEKRSDFDLAAFYAGADDGKFSGPVAAIHTSMEMMLDHPDLLVISAQKYKNKSGGSKYCYDKWQEDLVDDVLVSPKLVMLADKVQQILEFDPANKVIVFTKYREMMPLIAGALSNIQCLYYHGGMNTEQKQSVVDEFRVNPERPVLISTHAGAYGADMYMANYVIKYDLPYSHGKDSQINGRVPRAASEFDKIYVRDIVTAGTIEVRNRVRIAWKKKVADAVVDDEHADDTGRVENEVQSLRAHIQEVLADVR